MENATIGRSTPTRRQVLVGLGAAGLAASLGRTARAQGAWPNRPVRFVVPFPPGGSTDLMAREVAQGVSAAIGQPVVVENRAGAASTVGTAQVARAAPDGYTFLFTSSHIAIVPSLYGNLTFDPLKDFEYIGQVLDVPMTLLARKDFPPTNFKELQAYLKANGNKVSLANAGLGAVSHLCGLLFMSQIGVELTTVPYKGTGPAMNDLLGGQVDLLCDQTTQTVPFIKDGRIKVYGVTTLNRLSALPNVPTLDEQGLKGFEVKVWHGMYAPKGTPQDVIAKINAALKAAMAEPVVKQRLAELSSDIPGPDKMSPAGLKTHLEAEIAKWGPVIKKAGIYAD